MRSRATNPERMERASMESPFVTNPTVSEESPWQV
jgi:hypothetical protein